MYRHKKNMQTQNRNAGPSLRIEPETTVNYFINPSEQLGHAGGSVRVTDMFVEQLRVLRLSQFEKQNNVVVQLQVKNVNNQQKKF